MKSHTLNPFLSSLAADGICPGIRDYERIRLILQSSGDWTLGRFRDMLQSLLVKDQDQQSIFRRRFEEFFKPEPGEEEAFADIDVEKALKDLKLLAKTRNIFPKPQPRQRWKTLVKYRNRLGVPLALFAGILFIALGMLLYFQAPDFLKNISQKPSRGPEPEAALVVPKPGLGNENVRTEESLPYIREISHVSLFSRSDIPYECRKYAGTAVLFFLSALLYGLYLRRGRKPPRDTVAAWNEEGPRHFPLGRIGGRPAPRLSEPILDQLAEAMGYFQSEQISRDLNVKDSAEATARRNGIPSLVFKKQRQIRSLLILEDTSAESSAWNRIAEELKEGMIRRSIPVIHARFSGSPRDFIASEGSVCRIEDWENQRQGFLLLIFTDGRGFSGLEDRFALESLARWPMVAWMDLREAGFWDETLSLPIRNRIPVYPADPEGILKAVRSFVAEQGTDRASEEMMHSRRLPDPEGMKPEAYTEMLLGDTLLLAADCAMMPVFTQGLADALRRRFHPRLPPERIGRLYALPGTFENVSGIRFSPEILQFLRKAFLIRREEHEQEEVLKFLTEKISEAEPKEKDSLAYLTWESVKERVLFEQEGNHDLKRLSRLALSPVGDFVRQLFDGFGFPGDEERIPLRFKPKNRQTLQRLAHIAGTLRIPLSETYPLTYGHKIALAMMTALFLIFFGQAVNSFMNAPNWEIPGYDSRMPLRLEVQEGPGWKQIGAETSVSVLRQSSLAEGRTYRIRLEGEADRSPQVFSIPPGCLTRIVLDRKEAGHKRNEE